MMIKFSLLRSIPIVKRFRASKNGANNWVFWVQEGKILSLTITPPRKSIATEARHLVQKRCRSMQKGGFQRLAKIKYNPIWHSHFTDPLPGRPRGADFYHFWHFCYRKNDGWRNHPCEILTVRPHIENSLVVCTWGQNGVKMTQIQIMISSLIIHVRKNWFHSLLAKCLLCKNRKNVYREKVLCRIVITHYLQPLASWKSRQSQHGDSLISMSLAYVDWDGPSGVHDRQGLLYTST